MLVYHASAPKNRLRYTKTGVAQYPTNPQYLLLHRTNTALRNTRVLRDFTPNLVFNGPVNASMPSLTMT